MRNASRVILVGTFAKKFLAALGEAKPISVFRRSAYLENVEGHLACIGDRSIGLGPLNVLCEFSWNMDFRQKVALRSVAKIENSFIQLGPIFRIDAFQPKEWKPPLSAGLNFKQLKRNLPFIVEWTARRGPQEGLGPLIPHIVSNEKISSENSFQEISRKSICGLKHWLFHALSGNRSPQFPFGAQRLIGLGPGLTPSGDDFLCGVMIVLRALRRFEVLDRISDAILNQAQERTNKISRAHLECAAKGQGAGALHEMISVTDGKDGARLRSALHTLARIGHTSGWDSLAGVVCVLAAWRDSSVSA